MPVHDPALRFVRPSRLRGWSVTQSPEQDDVVWATAPLNVSKYKTLSKSSVDLSLSEPLHYENVHVPFDPLPLPDLYVSSSASSAESTFSNLPPIPNPHPLSIASTQLSVDTPPLMTRRGSVLRPLPLPPTTMNGTPSLRKSASFIHESRSYRDAQSSPYSFNPTLDQHQPHLCWCQSQTATNRAHTHSNSYTYGSASHSNLNLSIVAPSLPPPPPTSLPLYTRHDSFSLSYSHAHPRPLPIRPSTSQSLGSGFRTFGASDSNLPSSVAPVQVQVQPQVLRMGPRPLTRSLSKTRLLPPLPVTSAQVPVDEVMPNVNVKTAHSRMGSDVTTTTTTTSTGTMTANTITNSTRKSHKSKSSYDPSLLSSTFPSTSTSNPEKEIRKSKSISKKHPQRIRSTYAIPGVDELVALLDSVEERERGEEVTRTREHGRTVSESASTSTSESRSRSKPRSSTSTPPVPSKAIPHITTTTSTRPRGAAPPALILPSTSTSSSTQHLTVPQTPLKSASSLSPAETIFSFFSSGLRSAGGNRGNGNGGFLGLSTKKGKGKGDEKDVERDKEKGREWPGSAMSIVDFEFPVPPGNGEEDEDEEYETEEASNSRVVGNGDSGVMRISYRRYHPHRRDTKSKSQTKSKTKSKTLRGSGSKIVDLTIPETTDDTAVHVHLPTTTSRLDLNSPTTSDSNSSVPPTPPPKSTTTTTPLMRTKDLPKLKINDTDLVPPSKLKAHANAKPAWVTRKLDLAKAGSGNNDKTLLVPSATSGLSSGSSSSARSGAANIGQRKSHAASIRSVHSGSGRSVRSVRSGRSTRSTTSSSSRARIQAAKVSAVKAQTQAKTDKSKLIFGVPSPSTTTGMGKKTTMAIAMAKSRLTIFPGFTASKHDSTMTTTSITTSTPKDHPAKPKKRKNLNRLTLTDPRSPYINFKPVSGLGRAGDNNGSGGSKPNAKSGIAVGTTTCLGAVLGMGVRALDGKVDVDTANANETSQAMGVGFGRITGVSIKGHTLTFGLGGRRKE